MALWGVLCAAAISFPVFIFSVFGELHPFLDILHVPHDNIIADTDLLRKEPIVDLSIKCAVREACNMQNLVFSDKS